MTDDLRPLRDRSRLIAPELTADEARAVGRFEDAADADESLRQVTAQRIYDAGVPLDWTDALILADAAIAVMRGEA